MENQILLYILRDLSRKAPDPDAVYADRELAQGILEYIRDEQLTQVLQMAGISQAALPFYLDMRLARFRDMPYGNIRLFFCQRTLLAEINGLVAWFRENKNTPEASGKRLRLRELCARLGSDPASRALAREALFLADFEG